MSRSSFELTPVRLATVTIATTLLALASADAARAQDAAVQVTAVQSAEVSLARNDATLSLELADGRTLDITLRDGRVFLEGEAVGEARRGSALDRSWRELLTSAMEASADALPEMLIDWRAPNGGEGARIDSALEALFAAEAISAQNVSADAVEADEARAAVVQGRRDRQDTIEALQREISRLREAREVRGITRSRRGPFHYISQGIGGILSILVTYTVLFGIGLGVIFFGGRRYIEGVADTARHATVRSFLVGLAGACLTVPAFLLGIMALAISIVGIPALLAWIPLFPLAAVLSVLLGYIGVAHAAGESFAERRFYSADWFRRGNSYYFILTGLGVLLALFIASQIVYMAGPWLGVFSSLFRVLAVVVTLVAACIGFGAVLLSRAGSRPIGADGQPDLFSEASNG